MAIREMRAEPATIERIQRHRKARKTAPPNREALALVRGVVGESDTVAGAIDAVKAIDAAWSSKSLATRSAIELLISILELSQTVDEALETFTMLRGDGSLLKPLAELRSFVQEEFPDARMRIVPGDEVSSAYLDVRIPTEDYPSFSAAHLRLREWVIEHVPGLRGVIHVTPLPGRINV